MERPAPSSKRRAFPAAGHRLCGLRRSKDLQVLIALLHGSRLSDPSNLATVGG